MTVALIALTRPLDGTDATGVVEQAAAVCYDSPPTPGHAIAAACADSGHLSVWEHISFTFHVEGVSRALLAQLSRHRHISLSVRSQRYCREDGFGYVNPFERGTGRWYLTALAMETAAETYSELIRGGAKPEDARCVLPNAAKTELYLTANARALIEMSRLRLCSRAQREIRELFRAIREEVRPHCPDLAARMVPRCEAHSVPFCPEKHGCGRHPTLAQLLQEGGDDA